MTIGSTELDVTKQELITGMLQDELARVAVIAPSIMDMSSLAGPGIKSLAVSDTGSFTAAEKTENTDLSTQVLTFTNDVLALDQHRGVYTEVEDKDDIQTTLSLEGEIASRMATAIVTTFDDYLWERLKEASAAAPDHRIAYDNTTSISKTDILEARRLLNIQNVPMDERFLCVPPSQEKAMLLIDDFIHAEKYGSAMAIQNGEIGKVYGFRVLVSNAAESDNLCVAYHREAVAFAWQQAVRFRQDVRLKGVSREYAMDAIYGAKTMKAGKRQVLIGSAT